MNDLMSIPTQVCVFLVSGVLAWIFAWEVARPFLMAHPSTWTPAIIGGVLGFFVSVPLVAKSSTEGIWDFLLLLGLPSMCGIILGVLIGLAL